MNRLYMIALLSCLFSLSYGFETEADVEHGEVLLQTEDLIRMAHSGGADVPDPLQLGGFRHPKEPSVKQENWWSDRHLHDFGFGPGHEDFELISGLTKDIVKSHMDPDSDIPDDQRLTARKDWNDPKYLSGLVDKVEENHRAVLENPEADHDWHAHAADRLTAMVALQIAGADEDKRKCSDDIHQPPPSPDEIDEMDSEQKEEEVNKVGASITDHIPGKAEVKKAEHALRRTNAIPWTMKLEDKLEIKECKSKKCAMIGDSGIDCSEVKLASIDDDLFKKAAYLFNDEMRRDRGKGCGCTAMKAATWTPSMFESHANVGDLTSSGVVQPFCLLGKTTPDDTGCRGMVNRKTNQSYTTCMCFNQRIINEGPSRAWLSEQSVIEFGLKEKLGCDVVLGNREPLPPQAAGNLKWKSCTPKACTSGTGQDCTPIPDDFKPQQKPFDQILNEFKTRIGNSAAPKCLCGTGHHSRFQTSVFKTDGAWCLAATSFNQECQALNPAKRVCMCLSQPPEEGKPWHDFAMTHEQAEKLTTKHELGCTSIIGIDENEKKEMALVSGYGFKAIWARFTRSWKTFAAHIRERGKKLLAAGAKAGDALKFKWSVKMASFPKMGQAFGVQVLCGPIAQCARAIITFVASLVSFMLHVTYAVVRLVLSVFTSIFPPGFTGPIGRVGSNIIGGIKGKVNNAVEFAHKKHEEMNLRVNGDFRRDNTFMKLQDDQTELKLSKSLVPNSAAEVSSQLCKKCAAVLVFAAGFPIGPVPDISALSLALVFAPLPAPTLTQLFLGRAKECGACAKQFGQMLSPFKNSEYQDDFVTSCNPVSTGLCYVLASQRRMREEGGVYKEDGNKLFFQGTNADDDAAKFCNTFGENTFLDLYRTKESKVGMFSDIACGTPDKTPTPGMKVKDLCMSVNEMVKARFKEPQSCWVASKSTEKKPWNYFQQCKDLFECGPFNPIEHPERIRREAAEFAVEKLKYNMIDAMISAQTEQNSNIDNTVGSLSATIEKLVLSTHKLDESMTRRERIALADMMWKHDAGLLFLDEMFAKPECFQVRAKTDAAMRSFLETHPMFPEMDHYHQARLDEIEEKASTDWEPVFGTSCDGDHLDDPRAIAYKNFFCPIAKIRQKHLVEKGFENAGQYISKENERRKNGQSEAQKIFQKGLEASRKADPDDALDKEALINKELEKDAEEAKAAKTNSPSPSPSDSKDGADNVSPTGTEPTEADGASSEKSSGDPNAPTSIPTTPDVAVDIKKSDASPKSTPASGSAAVATEPAPSPASSPAPAAPSKPNSAPELTEVLGDVNKLMESLNGHQ